MTVLDRFLDGDLRALSKIISHIENRENGYRELLGRLYQKTGNAVRIGVTGPPGAGKSTLVNGLIHQFLDEGKKVGVIAVDPTSPFTGGALLGDRVRMNEFPTDGSVYFRSMATRGASGGLTAATGNVTVALEAFGFDIILIETVGVGQSELDIAQATDTVLVTVVPESGDNIQTLKAGLMEIGDIFVVNKSDRSGAEDMASSINAMLDLAPQKMDWLPAVFLTAATLNQGVEELYEGLWNHYHHLQEGNRLKLRRKNQLRDELARKVDEIAFESLRSRMNEDETLDQLLEDIWNKKTDIYTAARNIADLWEGGVDRK